jgi:hypothetical protein
LQSKSVFVYFFDIPNNVNHSFIDIYQSDTRSKCSSPSSALLLSPSPPLPRKNIFEYWHSLPSILIGGYRVIQVQVAEDGYSFTPNTITAAKGDQIAFTFNGNGHSIAQGVFGNACQPASQNPFYSGTASGGVRHHVRNISISAMLTYPYRQPGP